ncbi:membrane hypothetical protein [Syntrophobacter sp. SbD2]|nr:membrane hypothetical protein [Syntrophobacter sp. SbD2]
MGFFHDSNFAWELLLFFCTRMASGAGGRGLGVRFFRLHLLVAGLTICVKCGLEVKFLLIRGKFHLALDSRFGVAFLAFFDLVAFFPRINAIFFDMMALVTGNLVFLRMLLVAELHGRLGH